MKSKTPGREFAFKFLFQLFIKENSELKNAFLDGAMGAADLEESILEFRESYTAHDEEHPDNQIDDGNWFFANKLIQGVAKHMTENEEIIRKETKRENLDNLEKIERCVLLIGTEELKHFDTPYQVVINELVELAKKYGNAQSGRFVNGVLDGIRAK
ncbi:MAG: transcription antitermination factor NusB [Bdellovibrionota bacterium]|nr:transcription antitermination factor NusB [Bdellovibrionota bacterium]